MKYEYKTNSGTIEIEIDKEWADILTDLDRLDYNSNKRETRRHISYDAFGFVPDFMGKPDKEIIDKYYDSPPYNYAMEHLTPTYRYALERRLIYGDMYKDIGKVLNCNAANAFAYYKNAVEVFKKHFVEGVWLYSRENKERPKSRQITVIPEGLTHKDVLEIHRLRQEYKSMMKISELTKISF